MAMKNQKKDNKLLASLAVFRELYDAKKDVYGIISVFLSNLIKTEALYSFNLNEITDKLNKTYEFDIPSPVVKTSLRKLEFVGKNSANYSVVDISKIDNSNLEEKQEKISSNNEFIIQELFKFIENEKQTTLTDKEKERISHSFCNFLLDEGNNEDFIEYITAFILQRESDINFKNQLNLIREGVILYSGIKYNANLNDLGSWRTELTIYIGTEILFYLAGYNGELYKDLVLDFLYYVREINEKARKRLIRLRYFIEVKNEVDGFFSKATRIVDGYVKPNPDGAAMLSIIDGCKKPSDVLAKQADFFSLLKSFAIEEDTYREYFEPENFKYNVISQDIIGKTSEEYEKDTLNPLIFLNYISIHRKDSHSKNFENIGHILLTGNRTTLNVAWNDVLKDKGQVPLATNLSFLTNKFWFKLNKGFGRNDLPNSFNVITKAQIILSKVLGHTIGEKYQELQNEVKEGKLTEEQIKSRIFYLRDHVIKPEEIKNDTVNDVLNVITEDTLENFIEEQKYFKTQAEEHRDENIKLKAALEIKGNIENELLEARREILRGKTKQKELLENQKVPIDINSNSKFRNFKILVSTTLILSTFAIIYSILKFGWDDLEPQTYIFLSLIPLSFYYLYLIIFEREFNPLQYLNKQKEKIFQANYHRFNFDTAKLIQIDNEIIQLKIEIEKDEKP